MVLFHYIEEVPSDFDMEKAVELLKLADKFGFVNLKILMEAMIVESPTLLSKDSCLGLLLVAEAHNCALLREASMSVAIEHIPELMASENWKDVVQSPDLLQEMLLYQAQRGRRFIRHSGATAFEQLTVSTLRKRLAERDLDVDGSREVLVKRLKKAVEESAADEQYYNGATGQTSPNRSYGLTPTVMN